MVEDAAVRPNVELDDCVIMPNHVHGIIIMKNAEKTGAPSDGRGVLQYAPTTKFYSTSQTLGAIVRGFKAAATKHVNIFRSTPSYPLWQRCFYDHIIRNDADLTRIRTYISNNPRRWALDEENPNAKENRERKPLVLIK